MSRGDMKPHSDSSSSLGGDGFIRKRTYKACDRCRLKKSKCDGLCPCNRCRIDNAICDFGERNKARQKAYPKGYVELLERQQSQLVAGLREMYRRLQRGESWTGSLPKEDDRSTPLIHDMLERLGALKRQTDGTSENFEEDLEIVRQVLMARENISIPHQQSLEPSTEIDQLPSPEHASRHNSLSFMNSYPINQHLPTTPDTSPYLPLYSQQISPLDIQTSFPQPYMQPQDVWQQNMTNATSSKYHNMALDSHMDDFSIDQIAFAGTTMSHGLIDPTVGPCFTLKEWLGLADQLQQHFDPNPAS